MTNMVRMDQAGMLEQVLVDGNLDRLNPADRLEYYHRVCTSVGLNPLTKPFDYIKLNGRLTLYARKDATDQLRKIHGVSITITSRERLEDVYVVTARATIAEGRADESTGAVTIAGLKGEALANALMKAETKAKRRVTLSICGLGWLDETEVASIPGAERVEVVDPIQPEPTPPPRKPEVTPEQAADMFWSRFATALGGREWQRVADLTGLDVGEPATVNDWRVAWQATEKALAAEANQSV